MQSLNIQNSERVGIVAANHTGYVDAMLDCIASGAIAVPLREVNDDYRISAAQVDQVIVPATSKAWLRREFIPTKTDAPALISFTSGTEGSPKGVILTHNNLAEVIARLNSVMQLDDSISEYIGVPVCHSFGFGRCRAIATVGGRFFIPSQGFNPSEIGVMLKRGEINAISAVPSLWRVLLANQDLIGTYGKRVRWIEIGSQYMSRSEKEAMKTLFPEARIVQHYGLTEASRTTLLEIHATEGELLESVGQPLGKVEVKLTPEGQIAIRGEHVAQSYLIDRQQVPLQDEEGWFLTKDLGRLENNHLYYQGRADDVINCGGIKVSPDALETKIYASIGCSSGLAICRKPDAMRGEGFLVAVTPEIDVDRQQLREAVLQATQELGVNAATAVTMIEVDSLPKTATGKIQRKQLVAWYVSQSATQDSPRPETQPTGGDDSTREISGANDSPIQTIVCRTLNLSRVHPQDSFVTLGGDSLSYIQLSMQLERYLGKLPNRWEQMPVHELEKLVPQQNKSTAIETGVVLRAIAILAIVANHTALFPEGYILGGSMALLIIAGLNFARFYGYALLQGKLLQPAMPLLINLIVPYLLINFVYDAWNHRIRLPVLLMVQNFSHFSAADVEAFPFPFWFIELLVQMIVGFSLLFAVKPLRNFASASPWRFGLMATIAGIGISILSRSLWYSGELYPRVPHVLFWLFALGWCIHFAQSRTEKLTTTVTLLLAMSVMFMSRSTSEDWWILIGTTLLLWIPFMTVPLLVKSILQMIGSATYCIYLTHMTFIELSEQIRNIHPLVHTLIGLSGSLLVWAVIQMVQNFMVRKRLSKQPSY